ncbi:hypothetical protein [Labrys sp. ZIDIC5]|uniref:hypothetical protein n=1 Tax=Labrys sedimenti TaxID=3106036 RepID=UPI002ACAC391|nr:hypothetical protein [Labrys sp. ZIDIC5]MDZ5454864.1 hypothetical protein [Labrys sp. ZIDIC5]
MWGGVYNPIIPVFRNPPELWRSKNPEEPSGYDIARGYIDFFEPDAFVEAEPGLVEAVGLDALRPRFPIDQRVIPLDELLAPEPHRDFSDLALGQTILDLLHHVYETEQRFNLRDKSDALRVQPERDTAVVEALFGVYPPDEHSKYFVKSFDSVYKPQVIANGAEAWRRIYLDGATTPLQITRKEINIERGWRNDLVIYIFDPAHNVDLIDLWNMRGESNPILPIPIGWVPDLIKDIRKIISAEHRPLQGNPHGVMRHATIEFGRSITEDRKQETVDLIAKGLKQPKDGEGPGPLVVKPWRNTVWDPSLSQEDGQWHRIELTAAERRISLKVDTSGEQPTTEFETLSPPFAEPYGGRDVRWVNTLSVSGHGIDDIATVFPFNNFDRTWPRLALGGEYVTVGTEGWSFCQRYTRNSQPIYLLSHEVAIIDSLKRFGIKAKLSEPGYIAKQILAHLRGMRGVALLADIETLKLLNVMAGGIRVRRKNTIKTKNKSEDGQDIESEELFDRRSRAVKIWIDHISKRKARREIFDVTLEKFTERNVIRLGLQTICPHCRMANWHRIDVASYELTCDRCLKSYPFPQASLRRDNKNWAYRVIGPFSVPDYARGSYGSLLALLCISRLRTSLDPMTFSTALSLEFDGLTREADFVLWYERDSMGDRKTPPQLLIGESKSLGEKDIIDDEDVEKLKSLARKIPNSMLVISILRMDFTDSEKKILRRLVKWGRRLNKYKKPSNKVLLLTGNEIFQSFISLNSTWEDLGGRHAKYANFESIRDLDSIAEATVGIYLGLESFEQVRFETWRKRQERCNSAPDKRPPGRWGRMLISVAGGKGKGES